MKQEISIYYLYGLHMIRPLYKNLKQPTYARYIAKEFGERWDKFAKKSIFWEISGLHTNLHMYKNHKMQVISFHIGENK